MKHKITIPAMLLISILLPAGVMLLTPGIDKSKAMTIYFSSISAISAAATATVAVLAYKNWLRNKTLHDAYESVKDYILAIDQCVEHLPRTKHSICQGGSISRLAGNIR